MKRALFANKPSHSASYLAILFAFVILSCQNSNGKQKTDSDQSPQEASLKHLLLPKGVDHSMVSWNHKEGIFTFNESCSFSTHPTPDDDLTGFYWSVPSHVKKVVIGDNVTITGGFRANGNLILKGVNRETSEIYGTDTKNWALGPDKVANPASSCSDGAHGDDRAHDCEKWQYGAVSPNHNMTEDQAITVTNLTFTNARSYAITSFKPKVIIDNVHIRNTRTKPDYHSNSDGFGGGPGSVIRNSKIDSWDDAIKLYRNMTVENVTIIHNSNGAPFQLGWGSGINESTHVLKNILVIANNTGHTNLALFSASLTSGKITRNISIEGMKAIYGDQQKIQNREPLPLFYTLSNDIEVNLTIADQSPFHLQAPVASNVDGCFKVSINGENLVKKKYEMGDASLVTGCGW